MDDPMRQAFNAFKRADDAYVDLMSELVVPQPDPQAREDLDRRIDDAEASLDKAKRAYVELVGYRARR